MNPNTRTDADNASRRLLAACTKRFGKPAAAARAPGRVNLIGDHVDYCGGLVLPFAIERSCIAAIYPGATEPSRVLLYSFNADESTPFDLAAITASPVGITTGSWQSYMLGTIAGLARINPVTPGVTGPAGGSTHGPTAGPGRELGGCRIAVASDIPLGGGLSSSAALEVSTALAAAAHCGISIGGMPLARLCQAAEHEYAGVPCGLMDQAISVVGRRDHAVMLDTATDETHPVPLPRDASFVVIDTGVRHALADGEYASRRARCEQAAAELGVRHLAQAAPARLRDLDGTLAPYARHVVTETARVRLAAERLMSGDLQGCGGLMDESHASLRDDFCVSCQEIDDIVESLRSVPGVFGARITGGGFGGCVIALARPGSGPEIANAVDRHKEACPNLKVIPVRPSEGAKQLAGPW